MCVEAVLVRWKVSDNATHALQPCQPHAEQDTPVQHHGSLLHTQHM